ncbi:unnamed protein product [Brassica rapa subsp. trilocularis]
MSRKVESVDMLLLDEKSTLIKEPSGPTTSPRFDIVSVTMTRKSSVSTVTCDKRFRYDPGRIQSRRESNYRIQVL